MTACKFCGQQLADDSRFCTRCGKPVGIDPGPVSIKKSEAAADDREAEDMNMPALYGMVVALALAVLFPPWEAPPGQPPEFLGFHFIMNPPDFGSAQSQGIGVISRLLITIELVTIAVAGLYVSWFFRKKVSAQ